MSKILTLFWLSLFLQSAFAARCELWEDGLRITHARAPDARSGTYCFGYLHGRDRTWQMDYFRRTAKGTNAEVHGFDKLKSDLMMRLLNLPMWADKLWNKLGPSEKEWLSDYAEGVNHGFRQARQKLGPEFTHGYPFPEDWKPIDSVMVMLLQSFDQTRKTFSVEWDESRALDKWGTKTLSLYDPDGVPWDTTILKKGEYVSVAAEVVKAPVIPGKLYAPFAALFGEESGSNSWVLAPSRTRGGKAIFANDPHLDLKTPMFWYWLHVEAPGMDFMGASLPGIPMVVSGFNRHVAWGLTNSYLNTADVIRLSDQESGQLTNVRPLVWVKWGFLKLPFFFKSFQLAPVGYPVLPLETSDPRPLVLQWSGFHLDGDDVAALRQMNLATSAEVLDATLSKVGLPSWNFVFADIHGKIGHRVEGKALRGKKTAAGIREGKLEELTNPDFLTADEMPHVFNPKRGWVATANNRHWPKDAKYYGGRAYAQGFRATRLDELLASRPKHDVESTRSIQCDTLASDARFLAPLLIEALSGEAFAAQLAKWDYSTGPDCTVCALYRFTIEGSMEALRVNEIGFWRLGQEKNKIWADEVRKAFHAGEKVLAGKTWGQVHINSFPHLSGRGEWIFTPSISTPGDRHSLNPGNPKWLEDENVFSHASGASQRLIVEMDKTPNAWVIFPGFNARYGEHDGKKPWEDWRDCKQERVEWPLKWEEKKLESIEVGLGN